MTRISAIEGVELVLNKKSACGLFQLPEDREADVVVIARSDTCIGSSIDNHNLEGLHGTRLRTHGGLSEAKIPLIINRSLNNEYRMRVATRVLKSYQVFDLAINGTQ